jgi:hypothetical protein
MDKQNQFSGFQVNTNLDSGWQMVDQRWVNRYRDYSMQSREPGSRDPGSPVNFLVSKSRDQNCRSTGISILICYSFLKTKCIVEWVEKGLFSNSQLYLWFSLNMIFSKNFCILFFLILTQSRWKFCDLA